MLRTLVAILILANALFFAWAQGWLDAVTGMPAQGGREPQRLQQQVQPERMTLLSPQAATALQQVVCLELGPFGSDETLRAAQSALERLGVAPASWQLDSGEQAGVWAVATSPLEPRDQARKEEQYKRLKLEYQVLAGRSDEQPSLLLGRYPSEAAAEAALAGLERRALKDLRVRQLQAPQPRHLLRLPTANSLLSKQIADSRDKALNGARACANGGNNGAAKPGSAASR